MKLHPWLSYQRRLYEHGALAPGRVRFLERIPGWQWRPKKAGMFDRLALVRKFAARHRIEELFVSTVFEGTKLGEWVRFCRRKHAVGTLGADLARALEAIPGWTWAVPNTALSRNRRNAVSHRKHLDLLQAYARTHGLEALDYDDVYRGHRLGQWVSSVRTMKRQGVALRPTLIAELEAIPGWIWSVRESSQRATVSRLRQLVKERGWAFFRTDAPHPLVDGISFGTWITDRRKDYARGEVPAWLAAELSAIPGWSWQPLEDTRTWMLGKLRSWLSAGRWPTVEQGLKTLLRTGVWVERLRHVGREALPPKVVKELESIPGWRWSVDRSVVGRRARPGSGAVTRSDLTGVGRRSKGAAPARGAGRRRHGRRSKGTAPARGAGAVRRRSK